MNTPSEKGSFLAPAEFESLRQQTLRQIEKDFGLQGIEVFLPNEEISYAELVRGLSEKLTDLEILHSHKLQALLYQLDISEQFVREEILAKAEGVHSALLADAIIKRCFAKVVFRKKYS
ncbi:MAG: hypothetical protein WBG42_12015 [Cryomorphaceae bacterium]